MRGHREGRGWVTVVVAVLAVGASAGLEACATMPLPRASEADVARLQATQPEVTMALVEEGRTLYQARCTACHEPYAPGTRTAAEWSHEVDEMAARARLDAYARERVMAYLSALAAP